MGNSSEKKLENPDIRYLYDMKNVLYDQKWLKKAKNFEVYYMYRGIKRKNDLRYDITVIPPNMLGKEFTKTKGHYHPQKYKELYIVLSGEGLYLMQKENKKNEIEDVFAVKVKEKECIIIPPYFGHITINCGKKDLKMANWVYDNFESKYKPIEEKRGGAYYRTKQGWIKNKNYKKIPKLRFEKSLKSIPKNLSFLK